MSRAGVDREALTVAMAVVPGLYSRNKHFSMYEDPDVKRARARAVHLRGIVRQLAGSAGEVTDIAFERGAHAELRYRVASVRLERRVRLGEAEAACVAYLAGRAGVHAIHATEADRAMVDAVLRRLAAGLRLAEVEAEAAGESRAE